MPGWNFGHSNLRFEFYCVSSFEASDAPHAVRIAIVWSPQICAQLQSQAAALPCLLQLCVFSVIRIPLEASVCGERTRVCSFYVSLFVPIWRHQFYYGCVQSYLVSCTRSPKTGTKNCRDNTLHLFYPEIRILSLLCDTRRESRRSVIHKWNSNAKMLTKTRN